MWRLIVSRARSASMTKRVIGALGERAACPRAAPSAATEAHRRAAAGTLIIIRRTYRNSPYMCEWPLRIRSVASRPLRILEQEQGPPGSYGDSAIVSAWPEGWSGHWQNRHIFPCGPRSCSRMHALYELRRWKASARRPEVEWLAHSRT